VQALTACGAEMKVGEMKMDVYCGKKKNMTLNDLE